MLLLKAPTTPGASAATRSRSHMAWSAAVRRTAACPTVVAAGTGSAEGGTTTTVVTEWKVTVVSAALAATLLGAAGAAEAADLALGSQVFNGNCAACHAGGRNVVVPEKTLDKAALEKYLDGGFNVESVIYQVENGKGGMPAWADRLSEEEIRAVAEYVFKTASEAGWSG